MDATATRVHVYVSGAVILALSHNANENQIYLKHNAAFNSVTGHTHTGATGDGPKLTASSLDLTANYPWTGTHSFVAGKLKIGGAAAGVAILQYVSSTTDRTLTIPDPGANDTFVMVALAQSLTNKTLVAPVITGGATIGGDVNFDSGTLFVDSVNNRVYVGQISSPYIAQFQVRLANIGGAVEALIENTDNTNVASDAILTIKATAGNPAIILDAPLARWLVGLAHTSSNEFVIEYDDTLGFVPALTINTALSAIFAGIVSAPRFISNIATGTAPFQVDSTTAVANLNAALCAGLGDTETITGSWTFPATDPPAANATTRYSLAKGYATITASGTITASYNVSSVAKNGTGDFTITWNRDFANTNYSCFGMSTSNGATSSSVAVQSIAVGSVRVNTFDSSGAFADPPGNAFFIVAFGDQ